MPSAAIPLDPPPAAAPVLPVLTDALLGVERVFEEHLSSDLPPVSRLCRHVARYRGKMVRPTLVLLAGLAAHPHASAHTPASLLTNDHLVLGAVCEMVHMATLVHDDVLDEAATRRRGSTINALHGNEAAVMLGDYLIASAYELCARLPDQRAARRIGRASMILCEGELLQLHHRDDWSVDEDTYLEIVDRKTAELIAAAAALGAAYAGAPEPVIAAVESFARHVGIAFQIQDDLLDLTGSEDVVGKSVGRDLQKGKLTLPLIHHLAAATPTLRGETLRILEDARLREAAHLPADAGAALLRALAATNSIEHARDASRARIEHALASLRTLPESPARALLEHLAQTTITRAA
ncbi:MAG: polyprenyl synthetase family protein [Planctomycetota bacterium]|nr:polyprenyl synthetase family protein [Planctomycetota bacterium]